MAFEILYKSSKSVLQQNEVEDAIREKSIPYEYDTKEFPIETVVKKFKEGEIIVPDYQRQLVWTKEMKSRFIESLFLGVPIPPVFVALREEDGLLELIDGRQRVGTVVEFLENALKLNSLNDIVELNGFRYKDLLESRRRKFKLQTMRFFVVTPKADLAIRADIFDRLNSSGKKLAPAQIRKGAFFTNPFYQFIISMAETSEFKSIYTGKNKEDDHHELILRFFAYSEKYLDFKHDIAIGLNRYVESKTYKNFTESDQKTKTNDFFNMIKFVKKYFPNKFNKPGTSAIPRVRFEAISVGTHLALQEDPDLIPKNMEWLNSKDFKIITTSDASNNPGRLKGRIEYVRDRLLGK